MCIRGTEPAPTGFAPILRRGEVRGELPELGGGGRRPAPRRECGRLVESGSHTRVGPSSCEREVPRALLEVGNHRGQRPVCRPAGAERSALIADGGEQRVGKADPGLVELDHGRARCLLERVLRELAVCRRKHLDGWPRERGGTEQHVARPPFEAREALPE